jgi:hypothetical protein
VVRSKTRCGGGRLEDLGPVRYLRKVWGAAVFTSFPSDHADLATFRTANSRRPFMQYQHQDQADPSEQEAAECPTNAAATGKRIPASQQTTGQGTDYC